MDRYIIVGSNRMAYKRFSTIEIGMHPQFEVTGTVDYEKARKFHSLKWATHRARYLTKRDNQAYYVYLEIEVDGKKYYHVVDEHQNDDIFEAEAAFQEKINGMIEDWKKKKGIA